MIKDIIEFYKIGKELGLTNKEMNKVLFFNNSRYTLIFKLIIIIMISFWAISILILTAEISRNTYPAGTGYSTVRMKDFKIKKRKS